MPTTTRNQTVGSVLDSPDIDRLDAELLLAELLGQSRTWLIAHPKWPVEVAVVRRWQQLAARRSTGEPLAYLIGRKEFYGRDFVVTPDTLVPRPDSEVLVEQGLEAASDGDTVLDIGTGSGAIGISIGRHNPKLAIHLSDTSPAALMVVQQNVTRHRVRAKLHQADFLPRFPFDWGRTVIVANLPYLTDADMAANADLRHEPRPALYAGADGLALIRRLFGQLRERQVRPKALLLEVDPRQVSAIQAMADQPATIFKDLAGRDRVVAFRSDG